MIFLLILILLLHLLLLLSTQFTLWPEMVVYPYLMNNGFMLYRDIINPYTPLFNFFLATFSRIFGYGELPYQILTWLVILITDIVIFKIAKEITGNKSSAAAALIFFVLFSIPFGINGLWYDLIQAPFLLGAAYYFHRFLQTRTDLVKVVLLLTVSFFIKQQTIWLAAWFLLISFKTVIENKRLLLIPTVFLLIFTFVFYFQNNLKDFFYLTFYFPFIKSSQMPGYVLLPTLRQIAVIGSLLLLFIPFAKKTFTKNFFLFSGLVLAIFAYPRFDYFHLIPSLAVLSVVFGQNILALKKLNPVSKFIVIVASLALTLNFFRYVAKYSTKEVRFFEEDIKKSANFLKTAANDKEIIYIQNGPDQLLPLSGLLPTKPWAIQFPWYLEIETIQKRVLAGIKIQNPKFIVSKPYDSGPKYEISAYRPQEVADYIDGNYENFVQISDTLWLKVKK